MEKPPWRWPWSACRGMCCRGFSPFFSISTKRLAIMHVEKQEEKPKPKNIGNHYYCLFSGPLSGLAKPSPSSWVTLSKSYGEPWTVLLVIMYTYSLIKWNCNYLLALRGNSAMCSIPNCFSYISVLKVNTIVQSRHPVIVFNSDPEFELTFEEDFRIHELLVVFFSYKIYVNSKSSNPGAKRQCPWLFLQPCLSDAQVSWGQKNLQYATKQ